MTIDTGNGDDMIWNPSTELFATGQIFDGGFYNNFAGGQPTFYVTRQPYDGCAILEENLSGGNLIGKLNGLGALTWTAMPIPQEPLLSLADGLIPNDLTVKLRVANSFNKELDIAKLNTTADFATVGSLPVYEFDFDEFEATDMLKLNSLMLWIM